jgi:excisionase family DNA binding protein
MLLRDQKDAVLTVREVARILNIHENTVRRWGAQGILKEYRIGPRRDRRFLYEDVAHLLKIIDNNRIKDNHNLLSR